jgi:hypothetical protein
MPGSVTFDIFSVIHNYFKRNEVNLMWWPLQSHVSKKGRKRYNIIRWHAQCTVKSQLQQTHIFRGKKWNLRYLSYNAKFTIFRRFNMKDRTSCRPQTQFWSSETVVCYYAARQSLGIIFCLTRAKISYTALRRQAVAYIILQDENKEDLQPCNCCCWAQH